MISKLLIPGARLYSRIPLQAPKEKTLLKVWYGSELNIQSLRNSIKNATKARIEDCKKLNLPFFMDVISDKMP